MRVLTSHPVPPDGAEPASGLAWLGDRAGHFTWESLPSGVQSALVAVADAPTPAEALAALGRVRLLTAHREHAFGAAGLNEAIHQHLAFRPGIRRTANEPVIINHNDPETGLINGSVGIVMDVDDARAAYFSPSSADAAPRRVPLSQLPDHSPAWALTIHRSQGSELTKSWSSCRRRRVRLPPANSSTRRSLVRAEASMSGAAKNPCGPASGSAPCVARCWRRISSEASPCRRPHPLELGQPLSEGGW